MKKRVVKIISVALVLVVSLGLFAGCAGTGGASVFRDTGSWPPANSYIANYHNPNGVGWQIGMLTYEGTFCYIGVSGVYKLRLGEKYEQTEYEDIITYRKDVKWNDGTKFTAKDIWAYYTLNNTNAVGQQLASIELVDEFTIKFTWREKLNQDVRIRMIASQYDGTIPYHIYGQYVDKAEELLAKGTAPSDPADIRCFGLAFDTETMDEITSNWREFQNAAPDNNIPVGTGCYKLKSLTDAEAILVRNDNYYNKANVKFDQVSLKNVDTNTKQSMLQEGQLERMDGTPSKDVLESILEKNTNLVHYMTLDNASVGISLDIQSEHLKNAEFRQALVYILDRDKIREVGNAYGKTAEYAELGMPESYASEWINPSVLAQMTKYETNHDKATELLEGIGYTNDGGTWKSPSGDPVKLTLGTTSEFQFLNPANIAAEQLKAFGITVDVSVLEINVYNQSWKNHELDMYCNWIDNSWGIYAPFGPLARGYYYQFEDAFASVAGNFPKFTEGARKEQVDMVYPDQNGVDTDISAVLGSMLGLSNEEMVDEASRIAYITNENVFSIAFFQNSSGYFLNNGTIEGLPLPDKIEAENRNVMIPGDPAEVNVLNEHWYIWVAQGLMFAEGVYGPRK